LTVKREAALFCTGGTILQDTNAENWVIVIDPGHGGDNMGTIENGFLEKEMTLRTAKAMAEELSKYEGITVYLTRTTDADLTLKERAAYAKEVGADFLISLHYNASVSHRLFGSEVWIPSEDAFRSFAFSFGQCQLEQMEEKGLFLRGIKTKLGDKGQDYYGVIREASQLDIPAVIVEHCHVDEARDAAFCDADDKLDEFGRLDAQALINFLDLGGNGLGVTDRELSSKRESTFMAAMGDTTPPDVCYIEAETADYQACQVTLEVTATDYDTVLLYYDYSLDGGKTYSELLPWQGSNALTGVYDDVCRITLEIPKGTIPTISLRAYNLYDLATESNVLSDFSVFTGIQEEETIEGGTEQGTGLGDGHTTEEANQQIQPSESITWVPEATEESVKDDGFFLFIGLSVLLLLTVLCIGLIWQSRVHRKKRRRRK
jgi:N-acetylmuramoyl-L-alanine amidase